MSENKKNSVRADSRCRSESGVVGELQSITQSFGKSSKRKKGNERRDNQSLIQNIIMDNWRSTEKRGVFIPVFSRLIHGI